MNLCQECHLFVKVPRVDNGPVGHGQGVARTLGDLHAPAGHLAGAIYDSERRQKSRWGKINQTIGID